MVWNYSNLPISLAKKVREDPSTRARIARKVEAAVKKAMVERWREMEMTLEEFATMTFEDGNDEVLKTVNVSYTDFDFSRIKGEKLTVWVQPNEFGAYTIFLPSEY